MSQTNVPTLNASEPAADAQLTADSDISPTHSDMRPVDSDTNRLIRTRVQFQFHSAHESTLSGSDPSGSSAMMDFHDDEAARLVMNTLRAVAQEGAA
jgi:hypothetical protein